MANLHVADVVEAIGTGHVAPALKEHHGNGTARQPERMLASQTDIKTTDV